MLRASWREHEDRDWRAVIIGRNRPLKAGAVDGTLIRVPDTQANRAVYGSVGTGDDSSPFPQLRGLPMTDASTRGLLGMPHGPAGTDKAAAEQKLLDTAMREFPHLFAMDRIWIMDRNYPGAARIARLTARTHVLIRLKSDIPLKRISGILADGSYLAELFGDGVTVTVRVVEYWVTVEGQEVPELFCLVTDLTDTVEYPAAELAALYKWRWDGSETALREVKASLDSAGPSAGPMLRSGSPGLVRQELAAWAAANEMTRGVARSAAAAAAPARKGRRAGMPVQAREISHGRARRAVTTAIRAGRTSRTALARELAKHRTVIDRNRHRARKAKCASTFPARAAPASPPGPPPPSSPSRTRPPDKRKHRKPPKDASPPARGTGRHPARRAGHRHARDQELPTVTKTGNLARTPKCLNPMALGDAQGSGVFRSYPVLRGM